MTRFNMQNYADKSGSDLKEQAGDGDEPTRADRAGLVALCIFDPARSIRAIRFDPRQSVFRKALVGLKKSRVPRTA
jgi:hypothetical protein